MRCLTVLLKILLCVLLLQVTSLKCPCGYPPVMEESLAATSLAWPFVFDHKLGPWPDQFCIRSWVEISSLVPCNIVGVATPDCTILWLRARFLCIN